MIRISKNIYLLSIFLLSVISFIFFMYGAQKDVEHESNMKRRSLTYQGRLFEDPIIKINQSRSNEKNFKLAIEQVVGMKVNQDVNKTTKTKNVAEKSKSNIDQRIRKKHPKHEYNTIKLNSSNPVIDYSVHVFYYPWYKNPKTDGKYEHWNHELIKHWSDHTRNRSHHHIPPGDIGANFYPQLGPYSSSDPQVIDTHMKQISEAGIGVVAFSWYPPQFQKASETPVDKLLPLYLDSAATHNVKIALHIEPFANRSGATLHAALAYAAATYGSHTAFYRTAHKGRQLPLVYVYDSYQIEASSWAEALQPGGASTIRGTAADAVVIGLLVEREHLAHLSQAGFDGFYTYFASNGFSYGCSWGKWATLAHEAAKHNLIFIPSIGPGYVDTRVRPWNGRNTKLRLKGSYYKSAFKSAMATKSKFLSITSFNEWHEGTQIEAAVPLTHEGFKYEDYKPGGPQFYMNLTRQFVLERQQNRTNSLSHSHDDTF